MSDVASREHPARLVYGLLVLLAVGALCLFGVVVPLMPAPTNTSFLTATNLGTITLATQTFTQQIDDAGVNQTTYYTFQAPAGASVIGAFGRVDVSATLIATKPYVGPAASPTQLLVGGTLISGIDKPIQFPVTALSTYFLECIPSAFVSSPTTLRLDVTLAPSSAVPAGAFAINDDTDSGFPLAILSGTSDYTALRFLHPFPFGEAADTLTSGVSCWEDAATHAVKIYNGSFQVVDSHTLASTLRIRTCQDAQKFYVATNENPTKVYAVSSDGTISAAIVLTAMTSCSAVAASNNEATLYHSFTGTNQPIRQWTIGVGAAANLVAGIANHSVVDILVLGDDKIVVGYYKSTVTRAFIVKIYDAAGSTLNTFTASVPRGNTAPRLAYAIDDPVHFWVMNHPASTAGLTTFEKIKVSDVSIVTTINQEEFESGVYQGTATLTPVATFGASFSCPFFVVRVAANPTTQTFTIRRQRRWLLPSSPDNKWMQIPTIEFLPRTGIGLTPDTAWGGSTPVGAIPKVMWRLSKDGGKTWSAERWVSAGMIGQYLDRVRILRATGNYRNAVAEVTVSDGVDWQFLAAMGTPVEGSS